MKWREKEGGVSLAHPAVFFLMRVGRPRSAGSFSRGTSASRAYSFSIGARSVRCMYMSQRSHAWVGLSS